VSIPTAATVTEIDLCLSAAAVQSADPLAAFVWRRVRRQVGMIRTMPISALDYHIRLRQLPRIRSVRNS
jgi:hypothetical protein